MLYSPTSTVQNAASVTLEQTKTTR